MSTSKTWPGGATGATPTTYSIPAAGELNWASLSSFLIALADGAQGTTFQKFAVREATTTPVTVATSDCIVVTDLTVPGAVAVTLPAGANKQIFYIVDGKGDADTYNITITPNGAETIAGAATLVLSAPREGVCLAFTSADSDWKIISRVNQAGTIIGGFTASRAIVSGATGYLAAATTTATQVGYLSAATGTTGTTSTNLVFSTSPTLVTPNLGTPSTLVLTNATGLPLTTGVTGVLPVANGGTNSSTALNNNRVMQSSAGTIIEAAAITASRALVSDTNGIPVAATTTTTQVNYLSAATGTTGTTSSNVVFSTSPTLVTPNLGTPTTLVLTSATGLPLTTGVTGILPVANGGTNSSTALNNNRVMQSSGGAVVEAAAITASRALVSDANGIPVAATTTTTQVNYLSAATGTTGTTSSNVVFSTSPTLVTPNLGTPTTLVLTSATGLPLTTGVTGVLPVANGGTNSSTALNNNRVMQSSGGAVVEAAAITASRALVSDANGIPVAATTTTTQVNYLSAASGTSGTTSTNLVFSGAPTFTGQVSTAAGTAALPAWTFTGDGNTGMSAETADTLVLSTGGTEAFRITSAQLIGFNGIASASGTAQVLIRQTASTTNQGLQVYNTNTSYTGNLLYVHSDKTSSYTDSNLIYASTPGNERFRVRADGTIYADNTTVQPAADYAEMFEWLDGNPNNEDRVGYIVSLVGDKIKIAEPGDDFVLGVISSVPAFLGNAAWSRWEKKYMKDDFGRKLKGQDGDYVVNPEFDPRQPYVERLKRREWGAVGLIGMLRIRAGQNPPSRWRKMKDITPDVALWFVR